MCVWFRKGGPQPDFEGTSMARYESLYRRQQRGLEKTQHRQNSKGKKVLDRNKDPMCSGQKEFTRLKM